MRDVARGLVTAHALPNSVCRRTTSECAPAWRAPRTAGTAPDLPRRCIRDPMSLPAGANAQSVPRYAHCAPTCSPAASRCSLLFLPVFVPPSLSLALSLCLYPRPSLRSFSLCSAGLQWPCWAGGPRLRVCRAGRRARSGRHCARQAGRAAAGVFQHRAVGGSEGRAGRASASCPPPSPLPRAAARLRAKKHCLASGLRPRTRFEQLPPRWPPPWATAPPISSAGARRAARGTGVHGAARVGTTAWRHHGAARRHPTALKPRHGYQARRPRSRGPEQTHSNRRRGLPSSNDPALPAFGFCFEG